MIFFLKIEKEDEYYYIGEVRLKLGWVVRTLARTQPKLSLV